MKNAAFWNVKPCGSYKNRGFRGAYRLHHQGEKNQWARNVSGNWELKHTAKSSPILVTLIMEVIHSSETLVLTRAT
jgi:hypothetical protein